MLILAKFDVDREDLINFQRNNELPPPDRLDYLFFPRPPLTIPPVGPGIFKHLLTNPDHADEDSTRIFDMLPKQLYKTTQSQDGTDGPRWGLHFVEGYSPLRAFVISFWCLVLSVLLALVPVFVSLRISEKMRPKPAQSRPIATILFWIYASMFMLVPIGLAVQSRRSSTQPPEPYNARNREGSPQWTSHYGPATASLPIPRISVDESLFQGSAPNSGLSVRALRVLVPLVRASLAVWQNIYDSCLSFLVERFTSPCEISQYHCVRSPLRSRYPAVH
jgi:hypothetical protein